MKSNAIKKLVEELVSAEMLFAERSLAWSQTTKQINDQREISDAEIDDPTRDEYRFLYVPEDDQRFFHSSREKKLLQLYKAMIGAQEDVDTLLTNSLPGQYLLPYSIVLKDYADGVYYPLSHYKDAVMAHLEHNVRERISEKAQDSNFRNQKTSIVSGEQVQHCFDNMVHWLGECFRSQNAVERATKLISEMSANTGLAAGLAEASERQIWIGTAREAVFIIVKLMEGGYFPMHYGVMQKARYIMKHYLLMNDDGEEVSFSTVRDYVGRNNMRLLGITIRPSDNSVKE
jgi:hypothetical protein